MKKYTLFREGNWYKGNLHTHTTVSDGVFSPKNTIDRYKKNGYSFLAISEHMVYSHYPEYETDSFLSIPAAEVHTSKGGTGLHHMIAFGEPQNTKFHNMEHLDQELFNTMSTQELINYIRGKNNLVIYNHPYWSRDDICDIVKLENIVGMEIYNYNCETSWKCGNSEVFYEHFLWHDNFIWCFGTDDAHGARDINDYCGGYITVKTNDFSHTGIINAIKLGSFFASSAREGEQAPKILDFIFDDGVAKIWCEPCRDVYFYAGCRSYPHVFPGGYDFKALHAKKDKPITYGEFKVPENTKFVRASVQDFSGNNSWCQPIVLQR